MTESINDVIILGSGAAGYTAAIYSARANLKPVLIGGPLTGGQLTTTTEVENFPGFPDGIMGPALMAEMRKQCERFGTQMINKVATKVDLGQSPFKVWVDDELLLAKTIVIATGAIPRKLGLAREDELLGFGLSTCATCDGAFFRDEEIVVVGGGDSACEEAMFLAKFGKRVRLIHRRDELRASKIMADRVQNHPGVEVVWNKKPIELLGEKPRGISGAVLEDTVTGEKSTIECAAIFYAIGHIPTSELFTGQLELDKEGYIITKPDSTATSIPGVFAAGDVQDHVFRQAITAAGSGCMAAIECERYLAELE
ncbi:MAG: thioredoxin-disulfide reductase [bacterium]|nr:thioredoxin-disulfide reductase [bacterium]